MRSTNGFVPPLARDKVVRVPGSAQENARCGRIGPCLVGPRRTRFTAEMWDGTRLSRERAPHAASDQVILHAPPLTLALLAYVLLAS